MLIGRVTQDPEIRTISSGQSVANFGLATGRRWKDKQTGEAKEQTEFSNIVAWRGLADVVAKYAPKGKQLYVEGHLQTRNWEGKDGVKRYRTEVIADNIILLGGRSDGGSGNTPDNNTGQKQPPATNNAPKSQTPPQTSQSSQPSSPPGAPQNETEDINIEDIPF